MEKEHFISGYCRGMDASRMVEVVTEDGSLLEADCDFGTCPHEPSCTVAQSIREILDQ